MKTITTTRLGIAGFVLLAVAALAQACAMTANCPLHPGAVGALVGARVVTGILVGVYRCPRGHSFEERCN